MKLLVVVLLLVVSALAIPPILPKCALYKCSADYVQPVCTFDSARGCFQEFQNSCLLNSANCQSLNSKFIFLFKFNSSTFFQDIWEYSKEVVLARIQCVLLLKVRCKKYFRVSKKKKTLNKLEIYLLQTIRNLFYVCKIF